MNYQQILEEIAAETADEAGRGQLATYIPELAKVPPDRFGIHLATLDGGQFAFGDAEIPFSIQSIVKVLAVAMAALPQFLLEPACFPGKDDPRLSDDGRRAESSAALGALCSSLAAIVALYSIALASSQPRAVLAVAALALATIGWVVYGDWVGLGA